MCAPCLPLGMRTADIFCIWPSGAVRLTVRHARAKISIYITLAGCPSITQPPQPASAAAAPRRTTRATCARTPHTINWLLQLISCVRARAGQTCAHACVPNLCIDRHYLYLCISFVALCSGAHSVAMVLCVWLRLLLWVWGEKRDATLKSKPCGPMKSNSVYL